MPIFTQIFAIAIALAYIGCARALDALARTLLVVRSFLPEDIYGYKLSGRALDSLPELPTPLLVRCAFVSEQAGMLCIIGILSAILLLPIAISLASGTPTAQAQNGSGPRTPPSQVRIPSLGNIPTIQADRSGESVDESSSLYGPDDDPGTSSSIDEGPDGPDGGSGDPIIGRNNTPDDDTGDVPSDDDTGVIRPDKSILVARR